MRVLFLAANPMETTRLGLASEIRDVKAAVERGRLGKALDLCPELGVRINELQHLIDRDRPDIVHFSGHGSASRREIVLHDGNDDAFPVPMEPFATLLAGVTGVVLNACWSVTQAETIARRGPWAIGMAGAIHTSDARRFSETFYGKLADGRSIAEAFEGAKLQLELERRNGAPLPRLIHGLDSRELSKTAELTVDQDILTIEEHSSINSYTLGSPPGTTHRDGQSDNQRLIGRPPRIISKRPMPPPFDRTKWMHWLARLYKTEVATMLSGSGSVGVNGLARMRDRAEKHPSFLRLAGPRQLVSDVDIALSASNRLGMTPGEGRSSYKRLSRPLVFALSPAHAASLAIVMCIKARKRLPVKITFRFAHSVEMAKYAVKDAFPAPVHCFTLTLSTAAFLLQSSESCNYVPHMILPSMSHGVVTPRRIILANTTNAYSGRFLFMRSPPSSESFLYDDLVRAGRIGSRDTSSEEMEPDDVSATLADGSLDAKAIIGFPHYRFQEAFNGCRLLNDPYDDLSRKEIVLFVRREIMADKEVAREISIAVRDAWMSLRQDVHLRTDLVENLVSNPEYVQVLSRSTGLSNTAFF